ncbi:MAG: hypothetical protein MUO76_21405, partial [Anaerolineaceae bacterium]|nr:hypothetical protein [Anaerolineaceae bacterium]
MTQPQFRKIRLINPVLILLIVSIACNFPALSDSDAPADQTIQTAPETEVEQSIPDPQTNPDEAAPVEEFVNPDEAALVEELTTTIGTEGGVVDGPGNVELTVPEGAFSQPVEIKLVVGAEPPTLPTGSDIEVAGATVEVTLPSDADPDGIFELAIPFERDGSVGDDQYTVLRWDGTSWTDAGGLVEGDRLRVRINQISTFMPARVVWALRPVSFVNDGPYDAVVMPWTYLPLDPFSGVLPPNLSTVSFAPGGPGLWPNTSRFLGLPLGTYTFCVEFDKDEDLDDDGYTDVYHFFLEGPSADLPLLVDENDSINMEFAEEVRFGTDVIGEIQGKCGEPAASEWMVRLIPIDVSGSGTPPVIIVHANIEYASPPENVSIVSQGEFWTHGGTIALLQEGDWISVTCSDTDITAVGVRLEGDANDGWARVLVDGQEVWRGSVYGNPESAAGMFSYYLEVSGLEPGVHTIQVVNMGIKGAG